MIRRLSLCLTLALAVGCASKVKPPTAIVATVGGATSFVTGTLVQVDGSGSTDPQNLPLTFRWFLRSVPAGSEAKLNATDVISPSFVADVTGDYEVALVVTDGIYSSGTVSLIVTAEPCGGHAPQINKITFTQGSSVASTFFHVESDDAGVDAGSATDAGDLTDAGTTDGGTTVDAGTPDAGAADAGRDAGTSNVLFREVDTIQLSASIVDPDTDPTACSPAAPAVFTYHWSLQGPVGSAATLNDPASASPTFVADVPGTYIAAVQATDLSGRTGPIASTLVNVADCGEHPPTVTFANANAQVTVNGRAMGTENPTLNTPITLTATGSDPDNGVGPVTRLNCNPTGRNNQAVTINWAFVAMPFGSHATMVVQSTPAAGAEPVASAATFLADVPGPYVIRLTGSDSTGRAADPSTIIVNVGCGGSHPPGITGIRMVDVNGASLFNGTRFQQGIGQAVGLATTPTDADNTSSCSPAQTFTYLWTLVALPPGSQAALNSPTAATPSFIPDVTGTYSISLVITDSTGLSSNVSTVSITAVASTSTCGGRSPTIAALTPGLTTNITWHQTIQLDADNLLLTTNPSCGTGCFRLFTADDADSACVSGLGLSFEWSFDSLPPGSQARFFNPSIQNPSFVPDVANGDYVVRLTVTDTRGLSTFATAKLHTPAAGANPPQVQFNSAINSAPYVFTAASGTTPATIRSVDVGDVVPLTLAACAANQPQVTDADNTTSICATGTPAPQTFSYAWTLVTAPGGSTAQILNPTTASPSIVPNVEGTYRLRVVVTDSTGLSSSGTDIQVVVGCGASPAFTVSATPGGTAIVGVAEQLKVQFTNADSSGYYTSGGSRVCRAPVGFTYFWDFVSLPPGSTAVLNDPTAAQPSFVPDVTGGTWVIGAVVTDSNGHTGFASTAVVTQTCGAQSPSITSVTASADFNNYGGALSSADPTVTWDGNGAISSGSPVFQLGSTVTLTGTGRDNDNNAACGAPTQTLSYSWALQGLPAGSSARLLSSGGTASIIPEVPSAGTSTLATDYKVAFTVTDSTGRSSTTVYSFSASTCGSFFPDISAIAATPVSGTTLRAGVAMSFAANFTDANATTCIPAQFRVPATYTYAWSIQRRPANSDAVLIGADTAAPVFTPDVAGRYDVQVTITDAAGKTGAPWIQQITVN